MDIVQLITNFARASILGVSLTLSLNSLAMTTSLPVPSHSKMSGWDTEALDTVDHVMTMLGIDPSMMTNPQIIKCILEEMKLSDFHPTADSMQEFLSSAKSTPQPLGPLLLAIEKGLTEHPAVIEFLAVGSKRTWFTPFKEIETTLNEIYLLETLTAAMANSPEFLAEIQDHILKKRSLYGIKPHSTFSTFVKVFKATHRLFDSIKTISVDPAITFSRHLNANDGAFLTTDQVDALFHKKQISFAEKRSLMNFTKDTAFDDFSGLNLNIYEAASTEYKRGYSENAFTGHVLNEVIKATKPHSHLERSIILPHTLDSDFYHALMTGESYYLKDNLSQEWINLYETWNLCFILGELNDLHIIFPKLLIPSVLSAKRGTYMHTRVIALWLTINHYVMRELDKVPQLKGPENREEMVRAWGAINRKYADQFVEHTKNLNPKRVQESFKAFFQIPDISLLKLLIDFAK